jgi:hypothetical protein
VCHDDPRRLDAKGSFEWLQKMKRDLAKGNVKTGLVGGDEALNWATEEYKRQRFRYSRKTKIVGLREAVE